MNCLPDQPYDFCGDSGQVSILQDSCFSMHKLNKLAISTAVIYCAFFFPELAAELYSEVKRERESLERLQIEEAAQFSRKACVHPSSLVLALVYLERLKSCNPDYLDKSAPFELFVISLVSTCLQFFLFSII